MNEEATEKDIFSVIPETVKANGGVRRNSVGKANTKTSPSPLNSDELLPHYLRASTGSCHDFCKYGRKHAFESKERHPIFPKYLGSHEILNEEHNQVKVMTPAERRKRLVPNLNRTDTAAYDRPKTSGKKGLSPVNKAERFSGESVSIMLSTSSRISKSIVSVEHTPDHPKELSSSIKRMISSIPLPDGNKSSDQVVGLSMMTLSSGKTYTSYGNGSSSRAEGTSEEPLILKFETPSTSKESMDFADSEPANLTEGSLKELVSMNLHTMPPDEKSNAFADATPASEAEGLSEEPVIIELTRPQSFQKSILSAEPALIDGVDSSSEGSMSMELETPPFIQNSSGDFENMPVIRGEEFPEEPLCTKAMTPVTVKRTVASGKPLSTKLKEPLQIRKSKTSLDHTVAQTQNQHDQLKSPSTGGIKNKQVPKLKSTQPAKSFSDKAKVLKQKEIVASRKADIVPQKTLSPVKKILTSKLINQKSFPSVKKITPSVTPRVIKRNVSSLLKGTGVSPRPSVTSKPKASVLKSSSAVIPSRGLIGHRKQMNEVNTSSGLSKIREKVLQPPRASLSPLLTSSKVSSTKLRKDRNTKSSLPVKNQENRAKEDNGNVKEKTLYVVSSKPVKNDSKSVQMKFRSNKPSLSSLLTSPSGSSDSSHDKEEYKVTGSVVRNNGTKCKKQADYPKIKDKNIIIRTVTVHPNAEVPVPHKLKFRRGKVIDPHSENNGPRRLRFRQAGVISENQSGKEVEKRSFRGRTEFSGADSNEHKLEAPAVVLRHQDQQEKKDTQGLFNHVIEETASKLVETRKSKVKALVGAFETVISLQETKVAPTV